MIKLLLQRFVTIEPTCRLLRYDGTMQLRRVSALAGAVVLALYGMAGTCLSQDRPAAQARPEEATIAYRLTQEKTIHFDDAKKASQHLETVKKLGCEVSESDHEEHGDLTYRSAKWKALTVSDDKLAHQWEEWLKGAGFETLHGHAADEHEEHAADHEHAGESKEHAEEHAHEHGDEAGKHEEVSYRLPEWVKLHPQKEDEAQELIAIVKGLGCEVKEERHEGEKHGDVSIRCAEWRHLELPSHEAAESWQKWMTTTGFETKHED